MNVRVFAGGVGGAERRPGWVWPAAVDGDADMEATPNKQVV